MTSMNVTNSAPQQVAKENKRRRGLTDSQFAVLLVLPALILLIVIILYPLLNSMYIGFF